MSFEKYHEFSFLIRIRQLVIKRDNIELYMRKCRSYHIVVTNSRSLEHEVDTYHTLK